MRNETFAVRLLSRRGLLKNAALSTLLLPVLRRREALGASASPRRVVLVYSGNGPMKVAGPASGSERAFTLHEWWSPLERHRGDGIFLSHMAATGAGVVPGFAHGLGGQTFAGYGSDTYLGRGETIDQVIAKRLEAEGRAGIKRGVVWGLSKGAYDAFYGGARRTIAPQLDPTKAWAELFARFMNATPSATTARNAAALVARQRSVLDFVNRDCEAVRQLLGREGMRLLDDHCTTVRSKERNLQLSLAGDGASATCHKPAAPQARDWANPDNVDLQMAAFAELIAATLACELSHVVAFQLSGQGGRNRLATSYEVPSSPLANSGDSGPAHHPWTHQLDSPAKTSAMRIFTTFYAAQVALLLDKLKSTVDVHGKPLLDSTVVLWASELGGNARNTDAHQTGSTPVCLFGGKGVFETGRYLRGKSEENAGERLAKDVEAGRDMARLLVSVVRYMGLADVRTVGATGVNGPLEALHG